MHKLTNTELPRQDGVLIIAPTHPEGYEAICESTQVTPNAIQSWVRDHFPEYDVNVEDTFAGYDLVTITE